MAIRSPLAVGVAVFIVIGAVCLAVQQIPVGQTTLVSTPHTVLTVSWLGGPRSSLR